MRPRSAHDGGYPFLIVERAGKLEQPFQVEILSPPIPHLHTLHEPTAATLPGAWVYLNPVTPHSHVEVAVRKDRIWQDAAIKLGIRDVVHVGQGIR